jgi:hypothetical protein
MGVFQRGAAIFMAVAGIALLDPIPAASAQEGDLNTIRTDVRRPPSPPPSESSSSAASGNSYSPSNPYNPDHKNIEEAEGGIFLVALYGAGYVATSPLWLPMKILDDRLDKVWCFEEYPYEQTRGYLYDLEATQADHALQQDPNIERKELLAERSDLFPSIVHPRRWALRVGAEYADNFSGLHRTSGSLLLSSSMRIGIDAQWHYYEEHLQVGRFDALHLGDANLVFQIAQSERAQFRSGVGFNWLADSTIANFGFNFTYAVDLFPRKPWVFSAEFDAGTLGNTHLFHFRTTAGFLWRRIEAYTGFDYLDIGRSDSSSLVAGIRLWF